MKFQSTVRTWTCRGVLSMCRFISENFVDLDSTDFVPKVYRQADLIKWLFVLDEKGIKMQQCHEGPSQTRQITMQFTIKIVFYQTGVTFKSITWTIHPVVSIGLVLEEPVETMLHEQGMCHFNNSETALKFLQSSSANDVTRNVHLYTIMHCDWESKAAGTNNSRADTSWTFACFNLKN